ncbi:hypothetical protein GCM10023259_098320 [Thermocatellispora tengchongensis]
MGLRPCAQPRAARPKAARPRAARPKTAQPKTAQPKTAQPKTAQPKAARPKAARPKAARPKAARPKAVGRLGGAGAVGGVSVVLRRAIVRAIVGAVRRWAHGEEARPEGSLTWMCLL